MTNFQFTFGVPLNVLTNWTVTSQSAQLASATLLTLDSAIQLNLQTLPGQVLQGTQAVARLDFIATTNPPSQFLHLQLTNLTGLKPGGIIYSNSVKGGGRVAVVQDKPLIETTLTPDQSRRVWVYTQPGLNCELFSTTNLIPPIYWTPTVTFIQTNIATPIDVPDTNNMIYYRVRQQ